MNYLDILHAQLRVDEGVRPEPYPDQFGNMTIGIGRNLTANGINRGEQALMFDNDLAAAERSARLLFHNFDQLSDVRKAVIMNLAFNMGYSTLAGFVNTIAAIDARRWEDGAQGLIKSKWYTQVQRDRSDRLIKMLRTGELP